MLDLMKPFFFTLQLLLSVFQEGFCERGATFEDATKGSNGIIRQREENYLGLVT